MRRVVARKGHVFVSAIFALIPVLVVFLVVFSAHVLNRTGHHGGRMQKSIQVFCTVETTNHPKMGVAETSVFA